MKKERWLFYLTLFIYFAIMALQSKESRVLRYEENTHERFLLRGSLFFSALRSQILHIFPMLGKICKICERAANVEYSRISINTVVLFVIY